MSGDRGPLGHALGDPTGRAVGVVDDGRTDDGEVVAWAPGRVNLIGEHTDYTGGLALPMAVQLGTEVRVVRGGERVVLRSVDEQDPAEVDLAVADPSAVEPAWARYVAGVVAALRPARGAHGTVRTTVPIGAGLSSSAALELAVALALGFTGTSGELARLGQHAEQRASGVPCGLLDQLASACGVAGHALLVDFTDGAVTPVEVPDGLEVVVVHSGQQRRLAGSAYAERRAACEAASARLGPLRAAALDDLAELRDPVLARRARHVITENARVLDFVEALRCHDRRRLGDVLAASHASLRDDFEVSTPALDALADELSSRPGVLGARLTGAGFGGCVVALTEPGAVDLDAYERAWRVDPAPGASVSVRPENRAPSPRTAPPT